MTTGPSPHMLLVLPTVRGTRAGPAGAKRREQSEGALDKERAQQQRLQDETDAAIENVEDRPPPTGA